ncbi:unnamed protein product [Spirodela intermedia]|uniref:Uncharacterized protein n=1 Tax=Spirodela intermedia TaxID=51605 RepID=A0A7I8JLI3_SPIIN|nr:unnamed protein product [Spirodela intermedia]CAA6670621.1 unnamed protein product [Spirodela intermedia]
MAGTQKESRGGRNAGGKTQMHELSRGREWLQAGKARPKKGSRSLTKTQMAARIGEQRGVRERTSRNAGSPDERALPESSHHNHRLE